MGSQSACGSRQEPVAEYGSAEWRAGRPSQQDPRVRMVGDRMLGRSGWTAQGPRRRGNDAEGITDRPRPPLPGDGLVGHRWSECPHHRAPDGRETGLTWLVIAIETNKGEHNRLDHATRSDDPCRMAQRASSPSPKNRFRRKRPWRTPALCWTTGVRSRRTRPSRSGGSRARTRNASCGKAWPSCA